MKLAILGGTFNPIHNAHLLIAEEVRSRLNLDYIYFIPAKKPPHKEFNAEVSDEHRLKMVELALESNHYFRVSDYEIRKGGISYTIDTIRYFYQNFDIEGQIHLIIGSDLIEDIHSWKEWDQLMALVKLVVVDRDNYLLEKAKKKYPFICPVSSVPFGVTSTLIRDRLKKGLSIKYLVPGRVEEYIQIQNLYQSE